MGPRAHIGAVAAALAVVAACAPVASQEEPAGSGHPVEVLFLRTRSGVTVVDAHSRAVTLSVANAVAVPDWTELVTSSSDAGQTTLSRVQAPSGATLSTVRLERDLVVSVVSSDGSMAALTQPRSRGATPWLPDGRRGTEVVIADPANASRQKRFDLAGNFEPEAFSSNNRELFMIEYIPAMAPERYRVRRLKLNSGKVVPIGRLKIAAPGQMRGTGRMQVLAPSGEALYTLYTQQGPNYAHGEPEDHSEGTTHAFVHVLNLRHKWAHCIDLPMPFGMGRATASAVAVSPDGSRLYVSDWSNGAVAVIDPEALKVVRTVEIDLGKPDDHTFAEIGLNGLLYVAGNSEVVAVDADSLDVVDRWTMPSSVSGVAISPDGERLYVALDDEIVTLDAANGEQLGSLPASGVTSIEHVGELRS